MTALIWENENKRKFLTSGVDKIVNKCLLTQDDKIEVLKKYKYDECVLSMIKFHKFVILGMTNNVITIIEPSRGNVLIAMNSKSPYSEKNKSRSNSGFTSLGYFYKGSDRDLIKTMDRALKDRK